MIAIVVTGLLIQAAIAPSIIAQSIHPKAELETQCRSCDLIAKAATALSEGDGVKFIGYLDKSTPDYNEIEINVNALTAQQDISASIDVLKETGDENQIEALCDFFLQLTSQDGNFTVTRRRERVTIVERKLGKDKKSWRIISISPATILRPQLPS